MSMTPEETIKILTAKAECMRRETSGIDIDCNYRNCDECDLCYKQGTTGDQMEALRVAISALQEQDVHDTNVGDMVSRQKAIDAFYKHPNINWTTLDVLTKINALPSAQQEPCGDEVSRRILLNDLKELITAWEEYPVMTEQIKGVEIAIGYVKTIPSVTPKPRTGKWIINSDGYYPYCSECKSEPKSGEMTDFCPNYGADMNPLPESYKPKEKNDACD